MQRNLKHLVLRVTAACLLVVVPLLSVHAGGLSVAQQTARGTGMGDAGLASPGEPLLLHQNPAALSFLRGTVLSFGTTVISPDTRFKQEGKQDVKMQNQVLFPPSASLSHEFGNGLSLGISVATPYASHVEWSSDWPGAAEAVRSDLRVVYISPGASIPITRNLFVGAALNVAFPKLQFSRRVEQTIGIMQSYDGTATTAYGFSAGLVLKPSERIALAVAYCSGIRLNVNDISVAYAGVPDSLRAKYPATTLNRSLKMPSSVSSGLALRIFPWLLVEGDARYAYWPDPWAMDLSLAASGSLPAMSRRAGSWTVNTGLELSLWGAIFRAGYTFEESLVTDEYFSPALPDADRRGFSGGLGYWVDEGLRLDFAYQYLKFADRSFPGMYSAGQGTSLAGTFSTSWTIVGLNVSYFWN